jgi:hypothetical protein
MAPIVRKPAVCSRALAHRERELRADMAESASDGHFGSGTGRRDRLE